MRLPMAGVGTFETAADVRYTTASRANADIVQGCRTIVIYEYTLP